GQPRHVERALDVTRELHHWTAVDAAGRRRFLTGFFSEDGPGYRPKTKVDDGGLIEDIDPEADGDVNRNFLRDPLFCAWYSRNLAVLKFLREMAEGDYERLKTAKTTSAYQTYPLYSYFTLFGDRKFLEAPLDRFLPSDRWSVPIWRRFAERLPSGKR